MQIPSQILYYHLYSITLFQNRRLRKRIQMKLIRYQPQNRKIKKFRIQLIYSIIFLNAKILQRLFLKKAVYGQNFDNKTSYFIQFNVQQYPIFEFFIVESLIFSKFTGSL
ncbi:hypothetical protein TTHERM_000191879 (macronuclear) [Tetrahymena thermophila SB210]|uniref:Uncharacterized protein n=1 Tax=Tetrahymena thermophila (strain SB210) TaxID=312017 RepID=W7XA86_TETTS|nr:hypothetical protein TTHERM_000191879 [Tetrahymena thermophila SB210]EWS74262.1 hypothetical protein TTHERM_000191879 [Tetrahymena thermophila SB210]|eukprot:XP_012653235.1 hypothetical protein TTHERM_000191879 [Tetrahymena thermophila SB210]